MKLICSFLAGVLTLEGAAESLGGLVETFPAGWTLPVSDPGGLGGASSLHF